MQEVKIWVSISGDYIAWDEIGITPKYDLTNKVWINAELAEDWPDEDPDDFDSLEKFENWSNTQISECNLDYRIKDAILLNGKYYLKIPI